MARFKRLTAAEARTLTRSELLDRIEAEQAYWARKHHLSPEDIAAEKEFSRILHASINPAEGLADTLALLNGTRTGPSYFDQKPDVPDAPPAPHGMPGVAGIGGHFVLDPPDPEPYRQTP